MYYGEEKQSRVRELENTSACGLVVVILHVVIRESCSGDLKNRQISDVGIC